MPPKRIPKPPLITRKDGRDVQPPNKRNTVKIEPSPSPSPKGRNGNGKKNSDRPLTNMQLNFIEEYMKDPEANLTDIAIRAGYAEKYACQQAKQNLQHPTIAKIIKRRINRITDHVDVNGIMVINELARIAFADIGLCFREWTALAPHEIPEDTRRAIRAVKMRQRTIPTGKDSPPIVEVEYFYEPWDKNRALDSLAKHFGLFEADNRQKPTVQPQINVFVKGQTAMQVQIPDMAYEFDDGN